jgi:hypothetical protein
LLFGIEDIDRLRSATEDEQKLIQGLPERLVTEPATEVLIDGWQPLSTRIGDSGEAQPAAEQPADNLDVFFPKPFNDDQLEIIRRLSRADGLVVQGPPGSGKTRPAEARASARINLFITLRRSLIGPA